MRLEYKQKKNTFYIRFHFFTHTRDNLNYCLRLIENKYFQSIPFHYSLSVLLALCAREKILSIIIFSLLRQPVVYIYTISFAVILQVYRLSRLAFIFYIARYDAFSAIEKRRSAALYFASLTSLSARHYCGW